MNTYDPHDYDGLVCRCGYAVPDAAPVCPGCDEPVCPSCRVPWSDDPSDVAHESCEDARNERAYESSLDDYYGASSPQTAAEWQEVDARKLAR